MTFKDAYCAAFNCPETSFERRLLTHAARRRVRLLLHFPFVARAEFFDVDRELVRWIGRTEDARQVEDALGDYRRDFRNTKGVRRALKLRLSTRRLREIAGLIWPRCGGRGERTPSHSGRTTLVKPDSTS